MKNKALIIGGSNGIGLAIAIELALKNTLVTIIDKVEPSIQTPNNIFFQKINLLNDDFTFLIDYKDINILIITAGFGRIAPFDSIKEQEIHNSFQVNSITVAKILNFYFFALQNESDFYCAIMGSIAGLISSPLFALYGATKAAVCKLIESLNIELQALGSQNRILNVSPGSIKGTKFNGGENDISKTKNLAQDIIKEMYQRNCLYIPEYNNTFKDVIHRYYTNPIQFGVSSYEYKINSNRINLCPQLKIGYLSGTFDLFHIGHLNLLRRAKEYCDYLVVGVHKDASHKGKQTFIPFEERVSILQSIKYVDRVIESEPEDCDIYIKDIVKYNFLFVGTDYKGTERFNNYENYFADKDVKIIYFPYTKGTSSTQLREYLLANTK
ncbi:MAG: SDR family NAD(P)-dependent oxidoreductase [Muribaculaceae bacterium]